MANLTYSRELETEADRKGMDVLQSDGISLQGFVDLFALLKGEHGEMESLKLLSTHPLTEERLRVAKAMAERQKSVGKGAELERKWQAIVGEVRR